MVGIIAPNVGLMCTIAMAKYVLETSKYDDHGHVMHRRYAEAFGKASKIIYFKRSYSGLLLTIPVIIQR